MMYSEFVKGTGCKQNEKNYEVFLRLEAMYMNTEMSKEEIYEYGKKLVDNSKTEEEIRFENEIKEKIKANKGDINYYTEWAKTKREWAKSEYNEEDKKMWKKDARICEARVKALRAENKMLKEILA